MRLELAAALWLLALSIGLAAVLVSQRPMDAATTDLLARLDAKPSQAAAPSNPAPTPISTTQAPVGDRNALFPAVLPEETPDPSVPSAAPISLGLRGVIVDDAGMKAVFSVDDASQSYQTVGIGDRIGPYVVRSIQSGSVSLQSDDGQIDILQLRGAGEAPRN